LIVCVGPILLFYFRCSRYGRLESYHKAGRIGFTTPCLLLYLARAASSNGALLVKSPYAVAHTRRDFFEELNAAMEIDALKNPWSKMNFHFLGRPGLTAFLSSWSRAFSARRRQHGRPLLPLICCSLSEQCDCEIAVLKFGVWRSHVSGYHEWRKTVRIPQTAGRSSVVLIWRMTSWRSSGQLCNP
jgi:hypothetical protein